ncbi:methionine aminopeptidase 1A [Tanacetum coccineum]|uniref:Methionine aminopeptidase 1A n=1 Tax=Tanacetum coccineum TaxID=301880 RepID=A0ABQ5DV78_9ASTR
MILSPPSSSAESATISCCFRWFQVVPVRGFQEGCNCRYKGAMIDDVPRIFEAVFQCTLEFAKEVLDAGARAVRVGVTTDEIDVVVHEATIAAGMSTSQLLLRNFIEPIHLRLTIIFSRSHAARRSVNEVICHRIPDGRKLEDGDIVNIDTMFHLVSVNLALKLAPYPQNTSNRLDGSNGLEVAQHQLCNA